MTIIQAANSHLSAAKSAKNNEFYTQWADIVREMNAYLDYDPDVFRAKVVMLPGDDPEWSNFARSNGGEALVRLIVSGCITRSMRQHC
ncbi:adenine-specific methyltransferase EcoRI family protein [Salinibacterium sp. ZJ454]|uniref:adenine-specific methyltransferase EcoRI family protein n=1 Tax=Salinibacterium sp. ZJ454 TaxID=2708339 RepID=UPI001AB049D1|nr:adenine-specific methyltransferase EcoRI family protein [Salinibacterium sp. ZJ454]